MDHRQTPCPDTDFSGYSDKPAYAPITGEYKIPWPPKTTLHKHPSDWAMYLVLGLAACLGVLIAIGCLTVISWLF